MARTPVLPLFAEELAADVWLIGLFVGASTITDVFLKFPAGALSDPLAVSAFCFLGRLSLPFLPLVR